MTWFETFKFLHVIGAIVWVGSGVSLFVYALRLRSRRDEAGMRSLVSHSDFLGKALFMPAALLTLVFGVLMVVIEPRLSFGDAWIIVGLVGVAGSMAIGMGLLEPTDRRLTALVEEHGFQDTRVEALTGKVLRLNAVDLGVLLVVTWAMVAKPNW